MDAAQQIDYQAVLADLISRRDELELRRNELDAGIAAVRKIIGSGIAQSSIAHQGNGSAQRHDAFADLTIVGAATQYLQATKKPQTVKDIVAALQRGGYVFGSANPQNTVGAVLHREAAKRRAIEKTGKNLYKIKY